MLEHLSVEDFVPHVGREFSVGPPGEVVTFQLSSAGAIGTASSVQGGRAAFSLLFRGPLDAPLPQGQHRVAHPVRGDLDLFLVPVGRDAAGLQYEAIFN